MQGWTKYKRTFPDVGESLLRQNDSLWRQNNHIRELSLFLHIRYIWLMEQISSHNFNLSDKEKQLAKPRSQPNFYFYSFYHSNSTMSPNAIPKIDELDDITFHLREPASRLDKDCESGFAAQEIASAISTMDQRLKKNQKFQRAIMAFVLVTCVLVACVLGISVTAASLSQDLVISHENGFAYIKGTDSNIMKTSEAVIFKQGMNVGEMSDVELRNLKEVILEEGSVRFVVKGHARDILNDYVILLVEGGSISFDAEGIVDARGDAKYILETVYGPRSIVHGTQRSLYVTCGSFYYGFAPVTANPGQPLWLY